MQKTKMTTYALVHWITLVISLALIIGGNCSFSLLQGGPPKGKTMREYLLLEIKPKDPNNPKIVEALNQLEAKAQEFYDKDLKAAQNPEKFHRIKGSDKYISVRAKKILEAKLNKLGRTLDDETFEPVKDVNGDIFIDTRKFKEPVWGSRTAVEAVMRANKSYYEQTGSQFVFWAGARSPERQAISQALMFYTCDAKWSSKFLKAFTNFKCEKSIGSEVGSCFGTSHHPGFAFDMDYGHMKNAELAKKLLREEGFLVGCAVDKPHIDWAKSECW